MGHDLHRTETEAANPIATRGSLPEIQLSISVADLDGQALTSTRTYWSVRNAPPLQRARIALKMADLCWGNRRVTQSLACFRIASRLGVCSGEITSRIAELAEMVEQEAPLASILPDSYSCVPCGAAGYEELVELGGFSRTALPLRNTPVSIGAFMSSRGIWDHGLHRLDFVLTRKGIPVSRVEAGVALDRGVSEYGHPVRIQYACDAPPTRLFQITELTLDILKLLAVRHGASDILLDDTQQGPMQTAVGRAASVRQYLPELRAAPFVDLTQDAKTIWSGVRSSYRGLIRAQSRAMDLRYFGNTDRDSGVIAAWRALLKARNQFNERVFEYEVARARDGKAEIVGGFMADGRCGTITVIVDDGPDSEYRVGYYVSQGNQGKSSHYPVYSSILRARERGQSRFYFSYFGDSMAHYALHGGLVTPTVKGRALHFFKRGFSDTIERKFVFRLVL